MKKLGFVFALVLAAVSAKPAQADLSLGITTGANISTASVSAGSASSRTGFYFGGSLDYMLADMFYLNPELMYISKGFKQSTVASGVTTETDTSINYIELPLYLKVKFMDDESVSPFLRLGPSIGFKSSVSTTVTVNGVPLVSAAVTNVKSTDFSFNFGGGAEFAVGGATDLVVNAGYSMGLTNILSSGTTTAKNRGLMLGLGLMFAM